LRPTIQSMSTQCEGRAERVRTAAWSMFFCPGPNVVPVEFRPSAHSERRTLIRSVHNVTQGFFNRQTSVPVSWESRFRVYLLHALFCEVEPCERIQWSSLINVPLRPCCPHSFIYSYHGHSPHQWTAICCISFISPRTLEKR
jgi:hypothetical protein